MDLKYLNLSKNFYEEQPLFYSVRDVVLGISLFDGRKALGVGKKNLFCN